MLVILEAAGPTSTRARPAFREATMEEIAAAKGVTPAKKAVKKAPARRPAARKA